MPVSDETLRELAMLGGFEMDLLMQDIEPADEAGNSYEWTSRMLAKARLYIRDFKRAKGK